MMQVLKIIGIVHAIGAAWLLCVLFLMWLYKNR